MACVIEVVVRVVNQCVDGERYCLTSAVVVRAGSRLYREVEHLPVTMIRVPRDAWRGQTLQQQLWAIQDSIAISICFYRMKVT